MRKLKFMLAIVLSTFVGVEVASAQVKVQPRVNITNAGKARVKPVKILPRIIPPSVALARAIQMNPGAKGLNVTLAPNNKVYMVKLLQGNKVKLLRIPAAP